jgi:hypothetical protein
MDENLSPGQHQDYEDLLPSDCRFHQLMFKKVWSEKLSKRLYYMPGLMLSVAKGKE